MATSRALPRHTLAKNLKALLAAHDLKAPDVAKRAGVDRKTINNQLNARYDPRPEQVDKVAAVFGLNGWQLLSPTLDAARNGDGKVEELLEYFSGADDQGRADILRIAEMAARYRK